MKYGSVGVLVGVSALVLACGSNASSGNNNAGSAKQAGSVADVDCTHPGAGKAIGGGRCECSTTLNIAGDWNVKRTCREGDQCPVRNKDEAFAFTQNGTSVHADRGDTYSITGTLCGKVLVWSGGQKNGLNPECGEIDFADDGHFETNSCYAASGQCNPDYGNGCPSEKGQCTGTGSKSPEAAAAIEKIVCSTN